MTYRKFVSLGLLTAYYKNFEKLSVLLFARYRVCK